MEIKTNKHKAHYISPCGHYFRLRSGCNYLLITAIIKCNLFFSFMAFKVVHKSSGVLIQIDIV